MKPFFITVGEKTPLMIIPDTDAHADGHIVLTYTYSIYRDKGDLASDKQSRLHLQTNKDPDYLGYITFEQPGKVFSYSPPDGEERLDSDEVEEAIELITHHRDNPSVWVI